MAVTFQYLPLTAIAAEPSPFVITYRPVCHTLERSVARLGVISPLHVRCLHPSAPLQLVCGFKRLLAARACNLAEVPALLHPHRELTEEQAFFLALHDNLGCRTLNIVEKARALQRLRENFGYAVEALATDICPLLDLPPRPATVTTYCRLAELSDTLQGALVEGGVSLDTALWIHAQSAADQESLGRLFTGLQLSNNRAREWVTWLDDLRRRDAQSPGELLHALGITAVLAEPHLAGPQKIDRIRQLLRQARYPQLQHHEQRFQEALRRLKFPPQLRLQAPAFFEGESYQVTFAFRERQECQQYAQRLADAANHPALDELLDLL